MKVVMQPKPKTFFIEECEHLSAIEIVVPELIPTLEREVYDRMKGRHFLVDKIHNRLLNLSTTGLPSVDFMDVYSSSFSFTKFKTELHLIPVL